MPIVESTEAISADDPLDPAIWLALKEELRHRRIEGIHNAVLGHGLITQDELVDHDEPDINWDEDARDADNIVRALMKPAPWVRASANPGHSRLLAYFVLVWGLWTWEHTANYRKITGVVARVGQEYWQAKKASSHLSPDEELITDTIIDKLITPKPDSGSKQSAKLEWKDAPVSGALLLSCIGVEIALNNCSASAMNDCAGDVVQRAAELLDNEVVNLAKSGDSLRDLLRGFLIFHRDYYSELVKVADMFLEAGADVTLKPSKLGQVISELKQREIALQGDVSASELRSHRYALQALGKRLEDSSLPKLRFGSVKFTNIYPFTVDWPQDRDICDEIHKIGNAALAGLVPPELAGSPAGPPRETPWTDLWTGRGASRDSKIGSVSLPMPPISTQLQGGDHPSDRYQVTVRFNSRGNHYVQIEKEFSDPTFTEITQNLRRAFDAIGREKVTYGGKHSWSTLAEYADDVIETLRERLSQLVGPEQLVKISNPALLETRRQLIDSSRDHHTLVKIRGASVQYAGEPARDATGDEIRMYAGPLLMQPLDPVAATLHEWICRQIVGSDVNFLDYESFTSDFIIGTGSRTVMCVLSSPDWLHTGYSEISEFVASMPPLLRSWILQLDGLIEKAEELLKENPDEHQVGVPWWRGHERDLRTLRYSLYENVDAIRKELMYLDPSELVGSSFWDSQKKLLARLYQLPTIAELNANIDARLKRVDAAMERMAARQTRMHDQGVQGDQNRLQLILLVVSLFSFSSVLALGFEARYGEAVPSWVSDRIPGSFAVGYGLVMALIAIPILLKLSIPRVRLLVNRPTGGSILGARSNGRVPDKRPRRPAP